MGLQLDIPVKLIPFMTQRRPFKVAHGGRGSAKSWTVARCLVIKAYTEKHLILCTREFQTSIADSVHKLLVDTIEGMKLGPWFNITDNEITCRLTGSTFIFKGLRRNINEIKSTEGVTITWIEEAQAASKNSLTVLFPTVLRTPGAEIWITYNPENDADPVHDHFVIQKQPDALVIEVNWRDNPWFPEELEKQRAKMEAQDPDAYDWVWEGKTKHISEATIFRGRYKIEEFDEPEEGIVDRFYYGCDWGFANDPTVLMRFWIERPGGDYKRLLISHEACGVGIEIDELPAMFEGGKSIRNPELQWPGVPGAKLWPIKADAARPETISYVRRRSFNISAAKKWTGCVEDGVAHLKSYDEIIIHPRCKNMMQEARLYSYKVDKQTEQILPIIVDAHNHGWDALRYGHDGLITASGALGAWQKIANGRHA